MDTHTLVKWDSKGIAQRIDNKLQRVNRMKKKIKPVTKRDQDKKWDAHLYLAHEIFECAESMARHHIGYPNGVTDEKWQTILVQMRDGFRLYHKMDGNFYVWKGGVEPEYSDDIKLPNGNFEHKIINGAKLVLDKRSKNKFDLAMALFAKYFNNLWD